MSSNIANGNGADGMDIGSNSSTSPVKATNSIANDNTGLGINMGPGDTDGGGTRAAGNGSAHQCENIVCSAFITGGP